VRDNDSASLTRSTYIFAVEITALGFVHRNREGFLCLPYAAVGQNNMILAPSDLAGATSPDEGALYPHLLGRSSEPASKSLWIYKWLIIRTTASATGVFESVTLEEMQLEIVAAVRRREDYFARLRSSVERILIGEPEEKSREPISESVRLFVWQRDGGQCVLCRSRENLEFDHIIPLAKGGGSTERNIQLLCEPCNRKKGAHI
jgi:hypothetical protein